MTKQRSDERKIAGAGYVLTFFNDIEVLIGVASNYINNIARMKIKYPGLGESDEESRKVVFDEQDQSIINISENLKTYVFRTFVKFSSLKKKVKEFNQSDKDTPSVEDIYKEIRDSSFPTVKAVEDYVLLLNNLFVESVEILNAAQITYSQYEVGSSG